MNSYSIETQQNVNSHPEHSKIADIYQRMLLGDKSGLANLQKIKIPSPKQLLQARNQLNEDQQSPQKYAKRQLIPQSQQTRTQDHTPNVKAFSYHRINTINEEPLQESALHQKEKDKQKEKFRSYIKKKVNDLRNEKEIIKNQQEKQIYQIKKISENIKTNTTNQSKSYDLVKKKQFTHKTANATNTGMSAVRQQAKMVFENINIHQKLRKVQSTSKQNPSKNLPPLKQKKKIPTENSEHNIELSESKVISRKDIKTPISLADSTLKIQLKPNQTDKSLEQKNKDSPSKSTNGKINEPKNKKNEESRMKKISLPQMRKMREQFAMINEQQKAAQLDLMQYHQQTRHFVEDVKIKNQLNFRNYDLLEDIKKLLNTQPIVNTTQTKKAIHSLLQLQHPEAEQKKKKNFKVHEEKIQNFYSDIKLIEEAIIKKKSQVAKIQDKLNRNLLVQFWDSYDLQTHDFRDDEDDLPEVEIFHPQSISQSQINEAYSTAMPGTKDKKWKWKAIKQYDTNRSFQQYAKSRSQFKQSNVKEKDNSLNKIEQHQQPQDTGQNRVIVNSRLKKLLLQ